jgi:hypothetical protein
VLEAEEDAFARPLLGGQRVQILALVEDLARGDGVPSRPASTLARVLLPEPLGPMMAQTSPGSTSRLRPRKDGLARGFHVQILDR